MVSRQGNQAFAEYVRQEKLDCPEIILAWLKDHFCVSSAQLELETHGYYSRGAFRASMFRMARRNELAYTQVQGFYKLGPKPHQRRALSKEEIDELILVAPHMRNQIEIGHLYGVHASTIAKYINERKQPNQRKLTEAQEEQIRQSKLSHRVLALRYGVGKSTIVRAKQRGSS